MSPELLAQQLLFMFIPLLFSLSFHEMAHAMVSHIRGDSTARLMGRLTLNPFKHIDWIGTFVLPLTLILYGSSLLLGWAKPVPVNTSRLKHPRLDMLLIAVAGPLSNIFLALFFTALLGATYPLFYQTVYSQDIVYWSLFMVRLNMFLALLNLIPLHPLDGGKVLGYFLPAWVDQKLQENQALSAIFLFLFVLGGGFHAIAGPVMQWSNALVMAAVGVNP